jgi:dTDP-4-amino-4,6-dideoxygalactose transaminase
MSHQGAAEGQLRLADPRLGPEAVQAVERVLSSGHLTMGPRVSEFEEAVAGYVGVPHAIAVSSGTAALQIAISALGVGAGDEVIIPDFTHPATGNAVLACGATLRLVDVQSDTFAIDVDAVEGAWTSRTKMIIAVDPFGLPADYGALEVLARERDVVLLADAACSIGATMGNRRAGALGDAACFSFHPRKIVTTGEGGMVLTSSTAAAARLRRLRNHGAEIANGRSRFMEPGLNVRMGDVQAALGNVQMPHLDHTLARRAHVASRLLAGLEQVDQVAAQRVPDAVTTSWQAFVVRVDASVDRDRVISRLAAAGVESTIGTYALHREPAFAQFHRPEHRLDVSAQLADTSLALPLHPGLTDADAERVVVELARALRHEARD